MSWDRQGQRVVGRYIRSYTVEGVVVDSRVTYGGRVRHTLKLDQPTEVFGRVAEYLLVDDEDLLDASNDQK